jgi:hypothetical protein
MAQKNGRPAKEIRLGRIRAAVWANKTETGDVWFNVTVTRLYKDGDRWQDTATFRRDDLPIVAKVVDMAYAWIWGQEVPADPDEASE